MIDYLTVVYKNMLLDRIGDGTLKHIQKLVK